ncbi:unnamed protein product [Phytomonas sp. EM1]|nr:unnamed protein product [Phytomonas sp. EM1]|eukprot:CCW63943.1 unnamed protein product [Phytomonas sp. isolate EM1]
MRKTSDFEDAHKGSGDSQDKEQEFVSLFPFAPPKMQRQENSLRHTEARLFRNKKSEGVLDETKSAPFIWKDVHNPFVSDFNSMKKTALVYQNGKNIDSKRNPNRSDYSKDNGFPFRSNNDNASEPNDKVKPFVRSSLCEKNPSSLPLNDKINRCDTSDSGGLSARNKNTISQREWGRRRFLCSFSAVEVGGGLSSSQRERFQKCMESGPPSHNQVKMKIVELLQYWMSSPSVSLQIRSIVQDTLLQAGIHATPVREAWSDASRPGCCKFQDTSNGGVHTSSSNSVNNLNTHIGSHDVASDTHVLQPSLLEAQKGSNFNAAIGSDHSFHHSSTLPPSTSAGTAIVSLRGISNKLENTSIQKNECSNNSSPTIVQMTPEKTNPASSLHCYLPSTRRFSFDPNEPKHNELSVPQSQAVEVPDTPEKQADKNKIGFRAKYNGWSSFSRKADENVVTTTGVESSNPGPPGASYKDIPQFYFPLGCPTTQESVISGAVSSKIQNPHLKMLDCVPLASAMYDTTEPACDSLASSTNGEKVPIHRDFTMPSMSTLRCMEDRRVSQYLHKEFSRVPPPHKLKCKTHLPENQLDGFRRTPQLTKRESNYKHCLIECIERICVECFGVPRYFAFIILYLIQNNFAVNSSDAPSPCAGGRPGLSSSTNGLVSSPRTKNITASHLLEFYHDHLKGKDSIRRTFDLLILSSLKNSVTAADNRKSRHHEPLAQRTTAPRSFLLPEDFVGYINVLLQHHPGLSFLKKTPEFRPKYMNTVIYRIFYEIDRYDRGNISYADFASSRLMDAFRQVDATPDINSVLLFFSYEHFYVLYCRFWELDEDCDMIISQRDFSRYYPDNTFNPLIIQRIFSGVGRRIRCEVEGYIGYEDFVWFCLSEEDKSTPQAIRYWFRILDLDGDGILSIYEMQTFYNMLMEKISFVGENAVCFEDVIRQVFDMIRCPEYRGLTLADLLNDPEAAHVLLNMFTDFVKLLQYEQSDPLVVHQERLVGGPEQSHWDRFARAEYDRMAQETDL